MDRREYIRLMLLGTAATAIPLWSCKDKKGNEVFSTRPIYGRTPEELAYDEEIYKSEFFNPEELHTIAILSDIILPPLNNEKPAEENGLIDFIHFVVKDMEDNQKVMKEGLSWLNQESNNRFQNTFNDITEENRIAIIDDIAYPDKARENLEKGVEFFNHIRNLVVTGYYTSKEGIADLGYKGNSPNIWDGVPQEVLDKHGLQYEKEWLAKCIDQEKRGDIAKWDINKNLIS